MKKYDIPTAAYETFTDAEEAKAFIRKMVHQLSLKQTVLLLEKALSLR